MGEQSNTWDVVVVGGGFCGCWALNELRKQGFRTHLFEAGGDLGGIWYVKRASIHCLGQSLMIRPVGVGIGMSTRQ